MTNQIEQQSSAGFVTPEDFNEWPDFPCMLIATPHLSSRLSRRVRINDHHSIPFETDLFKGEAMVFVDGLATTPPELFRVSRLVSSGFDVA